MRLAYYVLVSPVAILTLPLGMDVEEPFQGAIPWAHGAGKQEGPTEGAQEFCAKLVPNKWRKQGLCQFVPRISGLSKKLSP